MPCYFLTFFYTADSAKIVNTFSPESEYYSEVKNPSPRLSLALLLCFLAVPTHAISTHNIFVTTFSILSYAKWNALSSTPVLCVVDNTNLANQFKTVAQQSKYNYQVQSITLPNLSKSSCQAVFFSTFTPRQEQNILNTQLNTATLSFSSNNNECEVGSAFCLYKRKQLTSFKVNLDSLSQSKVHVDPRVLLLTKSSEE